MRDLGAELRDVSLPHSPYAVATYTLDADGVGRGYSSVRADIDKLAEAMKTGKFPGYPETIQTIDLPPWAA